MNSNYKTFDLKDVSIECWTYDNRSTWGHKAQAGDTTVKKRYLNRTWESYCYQDVIHKLLDKIKRPDLKELADKVGSGYVDKELGALKGLAIMAGIMGTSDTQLKVLESAGCEKPDDWDTLPEEEKQDRLKKAIEVL